MPQIRIIRAALREIQKLPYSGCEKVYEILRRLSLGETTDTKPLRGYNKILRTRLGNWRVIWLRVDVDNIVVIKAGLRSSVYDDEFERRDCENPQIIEELLNPQRIEVTEHPSYQWNYHINSDWYKFVFSSYRYSPVRTDYQKEVLQKVFNTFSTYRYSRDSEELSHKPCIIQSAPGTGKTLCATLFACEIHQQNQWNIMLIVPDALKKDISKYSEIQQATLQDNFWLVTFREWLCQINPEFKNQLASPEEELKALQSAAKHTHRKFAKPEAISYRDVILYQSFVVDRENKKQIRNSVFQENRSQIEKLKKIDRRFWLKGLSSKKSRIDVASELIENPSLATLIPGNTLVIVDEAQDLMLCELEALVATCKAWEKENPENQIYLWLLGDLNQRIVPTDFDWGQLNLGEITSLKRNYRNSCYIIEFANQFWHLAKNINKQFKGRSLPQPVNREDAFESGEKVRFLKCNSKDDALNFLQQLAQQCKSGENQFYLLQDLANAVKVMSNKNLNISEDNLVILNTEDAKGREFEACIAFGLFEGSGKPSLEEAFQWYTLLTRARTRLLIVITPEELNRLNNNERNYFENCLSISSGKAINWITELASDVDVSRVYDIKERLLKRCKTGLLYRDTYLALQLAEIEGVELYQWEQKAISRLKKHSHKFLKEELNNIHSISLRCLLLRTMDFYWQAVMEATQLENTDFNEYKRLLKSIAQDLKMKEFSYKTAGVKARLVQDRNTTIPFCKEIGQNLKTSQTSVTLLCKAFASRINNILEQKEINSPSSKLLSKNLKY
ncbi:MAG: DEAD/DEAH box helicase family protein [Rivularia sp. (in: cyanobacteria)]